MDFDGFCINDNLQSLTLRREIYEHNISHVAFKGTKNALCGSVKEGI